MPEHWTISFCPEHGPYVKIDEDGCCIGCGITAVGRYIEQYFGDGGKLAALEAENELLRNQLGFARAAQAKAEAENARLRGELNAAKQHVSILQKANDQLHEEKFEEYQKAYHVFMERGEDIRRNAEEMVERLAKEGHTQKQEFRHSGPKWGLFFQAADLIRELAGLEE